MGTPGVFRFVIQGIIHRNLRAPLDA